MGEGHLRAWGTPGDGLSGDRCKVHLITSLIADPASCPWCGFLKPLAGQLAALLWTPSHNTLEFMCTTHHTLSSTVWGIDSFPLRQSNGVTLYENSGGGGVYFVGETHLVREIDPGLPLPHRLADLGNNT